MKNSSFDNSLLAEFTDPNTLIAGIDEVGRGALLGPVVAATVLLPLSSVPQLIRLGVKDSKKLSAPKRQALIEPIKELVSSWQISSASAAEIDKINILQASLLAMRRSVLDLPTAPDFCLVDGKFSIPDLNLEQKAVIQGDLRSPIIAAASILAKEWRDKFIIDLAEKYPDYDLARNKGYPTPNHRTAIKRHGICPEHRQSFKSCQ